MAVTLPRIRLATLPTPLVRARRLESTPSARPIYLKRDLTGFGIAGNKARALEFLVGDAVEQRADAPGRSGESTSNFCAPRRGCPPSGWPALLFSGPPPETSSVTVELAEACGARLCFDSAATREQWTTRCSPAEGCAEGSATAAVPRGGAAGVGAAGYACASTELADRCVASGVTPALVVVASGSGGAGGLSWPVRSASDCRGV